MFQKTPLAWSELLHNKARLASSLMGIAFAVFLMFMQIGFMNGVYDSQTNVIGKLNADLFVMNQLKEDLLPIQPFSRTRLVQALATEGVVDAYPLYLAEYGSTWKNFDNDKTHIVVTFGFRPSDPVFLMPEVLAHAKELEMPDTAMFDARSRDMFGRIEQGTIAELSGRRVDLIGTFDIGANFRVDGHLLMSETNFLRFFSNPMTGEPDPNQIELGLLKADPNLDLTEIKQSLTSRLPDDVIVLTKPEFVERIRSYWATFTPVGKIFGLGVVIGFVIGVTVCYQILFNDIAENAPQFATLKAIGYTNRYLLKVVMQKAVLLAILGFLPGLVLSALLYNAVEGWTGILMDLKPDRVFTVLVLSIFMCVFAGMLAVRKVVQTDPAELY